MTACSAESEGDLRVWWIPQIPCRPFHVAVKTLHEAKLVTEALADYDRFQFENRINAGGVCRSLMKGSGLIGMTLTVLPSKNGATNDDPRHLHPPALGQLHRARREAIRDPPLAGTTALHRSKGGSTSRPRRSRAFVLCAPADQRDACSGHRHEAVLNDTVLRVP